ncbi:MAG: hypothetical protein JHC95_12080 [Solirubrobacteraceae bacterium]|nr:hypothetical protein [Solirubrobacteraceae bacterium]
MPFALIHVDDVPGGPGEEAYVIVPGGEKVAIAVPLDAVGRLAPLIREATEEQGRPCCQACRKPLPVRPNPDGE